MKSNFLGIFERIMLILTISVTSIVSVLDLTGLLDSNSWITQRIPVITLISVTFVASHVILNYEKMLRSINSSSQHIIRSLNGVEICVYNSRAEFAEILIDKLKKANQVDSVVWTNKMRSEPSTVKDSEFYSEYSKVSNEIMQKRDIVWREVFVPDKKLVKRCEERLLNDDIRGYYAGYYEHPIPENLPRFSFMIINNRDNNTKELFFFRLPDMTNVRLHVCHVDLVNYFENFYTIIWNGAKKINEENDTNFNLLNDLKNNLQS